jgi:uncharacterized protein (DUF2147 family)
MSTATDKADAADAKAHADEDKKKAKAKGDAPVEYADQINKVAAGVTTLCAAGLGAGDAAKIALAVWEATCCE